MKIKVVLPVLILFCLLLPAICSAEWEYITHGGYDAAVSAWTRTALIFSDNNYKGLFISAIVLGALAIFAATYVRMVTGAKAGGLSWAAPVLIGMAIYVAFIAPKDRLIIYDELLNRGPQEVGGIPLILATSAGVLNKIEKGFTDIISTSTDPASDYRLNAGGTGWSLLDAVTPASVLPPNQYATVQRFIKDCVYPELVREGTILDINKIAEGEQKYDVVVSESANPALYTVVYTDNGAGDPVTCSNAAQIVNNILTNYTFGDLALKTACASRGFDTSGPSLNVCRNLIDSTLTTTFPGSTGGNISFGIFWAQRVLADAFMQVAEQSSPSVAITTLATSQTQSQFIGLGMHANTWIPVLKESLTAVAISITPLLLLFAATPLVNRALSLVFGMFVWLTMWGIIDAVIHAFGVDLAKQASQTIKTVSGDMGFTAMLMWPGYTAKVAATFGALRWAGLMLASVISGMLVKFGGTALAILASSISAMPQSSGAAYGGTLLKHADRVVSGEIMPTQTWSNAAVMAGGIRALTGGLVQKQVGEMVGSSMIGNEFGAGRIAQATFMSGGTNIAAQERNYGIMQRAMQTMGLTRDQAMQLGAVTGWNVATIEGFGMLRKEGFINPNQDFSSQLDSLQKYAPNIRGIDRNTIAVSVGGTDFYGKGGTFTAVATNLGQLNLKGAVSQSLEKDIQTKFDTGVSHDWEKMKRFNISDASTTGVDKTTAEEFTRQMKLSIVRQFGTNNAFKESIKSDSEQRLFTELSAGADVSFVKVKGGYQAIVRTAQGLEKSYTVSEDFKKAYDLAEQNAFRETVSQFARDEHKVQALRDWADRSGAKQVKDYIESVRLRESYQNASENQENVQFVHYIARSLGIDSSNPHNFNSVAARIREYAASSNPEDKQVLQNMIEGYKDYRIYGHKIQEGIDLIENQKHQIYNEFNGQAGEVSKMTSSKVPKAVRNTSVQQIDPTQFNSELKNVQIGLENRKELGKYALLPGWVPSWQEQEIMDITCIIIMECLIT